MGRGSNNLNYDDGFKYERENYKIFEPVLKNILGANQLEASRTLIDINWYCIRTNTRKRLRY
jgi:hypothetical protein